jgi:hypothetical protein
MRRLLATICCLFVAASSQAKPELVAKLRDWSVVKVTDSMTDKSTCVAIYRDTSNIALHAERLSITMKGRGGVSAYQYRYDKQSATDFAPRMSTDSRDMWWTGDMDRLLSSARLQVRIKPLIGNIADFDIDLSNAKAVHAVLVGEKCR